MTLIHSTPTASRLERWLRVFLPGLTLFYVLFVFQGFGIHTGISYSGHGFLGRCIGFGLLNVVVFAAVEFLFFRRWARATWQERMLSLFLMADLGAGATFLLFNYFWAWTEWNFSAFSLLLREYLTVVLIPLALIELFFLRRRKNVPSATMPLPQVVDGLVFASENGKDVISLHPDDFLYAQSADNYVEVYYVSGEEVKCHLLRKSLKSLEEHHLASPYVKRSHRSYLVNPTRVRNRIQERGKLALDLGYAKVPVSATFQEAFSQNLKNV
ncbi:MAG TPA: hypothetical protein DCE41_07680 [Cytophagales bacterium]|nr:hypothetical protein [Cytophagales bacterium]HAA24286.1 hypothetical protein [Cytophagales bacterium]HAP64339.1 hypothetical protein [Cytophagales bacterium]